MSAMPQSPEQCPGECELLEGGHSVKICSMSIYLLKVPEIGWSEEAPGTRKSGRATPMVVATQEAGFGEASSDSGLVSCRDGISHRPAPTHAFYFQTP